MFKSMIIVTFCSKLKHLSQDGSFIKNRPKSSDTEDCSAIMCSFCVVLICFIWTFNNDGSTSLPTKTINNQEQKL